MKPILLWLLSSRDELMSALSQPVEPDKASRLPDLHFAVGSNDVRSGPYDNSCEFDWRFVDAFNDKVRRI
jgi:hypothetical protein